jgi:hypothetical protein
MADAGGNKAYQDFVIPRPFQLKGFDLQGAAFSAQNGRLNLANLNIGIMFHRTAPLPRLFMLRRLVARNWSK